MKRPVALTLLAAFALHGCVTSRVSPVAEYPAVPDQSVFLVGGITYDEHGRPGFGERLARRPGSAGQRFTVVHAVRGRPLRSYDVTIVGSDADLGRPFAVIYDWTGRGFEGGVEITSGIAPNATIRSGAEAAAYLAIKAAPIVITTATGFVVGVLASIPAAAEELGKVLVDAREAVTGRAEYSYDDSGRIRFMKLYPPAEHAEPLVSTEFVYEGDAPSPARTIVTSVPEKRVRIVP